VNATFARTRPLSLRAPIATEEEHALFERRMRLASAVIFVLAFGFWVIATTSIAFVAPEKLPMQITSWPALVQLGTTAYALLVWAVVRTRRRSPVVLDVLDVVTAIGLCIGWTLSVVHAPMRSARPEMIALLACSYTLVTRAALIPSTPARTAALGVLGLAPVIPVTALFYARYPIDVALPLSPAAYIAIWAALGVAATTVISYVIYGLRMQIRKAMQLGQYVLEEEIGQGGIGVVYRARHAMLRRPTAIKLLQGSTGSAVERFEREVQITARLTHPNTVAVFDYGRTPDGVFYYAMEYLEGITLEDLVETHGPQDPARVVHVLLQICGALEEAHGVGLVHRDIKPANVMLTERGGIPDVVKVLDFGLVKERLEADAKLSGVNTILGTPHYMAPEAILDPSAIDGRADLYAVGAVGYFLLTGERVFEGSNLIEICSQHLHQTPVAPSEKRSGIPEALEAAVLSCLAKKPGERPASASALAAVLRACGAGEWTRDDAERWWSAPGATKLVTRSRGPRSSAAIGKTVAVDLEQRAG
jgi:serine/threonine-protein kinase